MNKLILIAITLCACGSVATLEDAATDTSSSTDGHGFVVLPDGRVVSDDATPDQDGGTVTTDAPTDSATADVFCNGCYNSEGTCIESTVEHCGYNNACVVCTTVDMCSVPICNGAGGCGYVERFTASGGWLDNCVDNAGAAGHCQFLNGSPYFCNTQCGHTGQPCCQQGCYDPRGGCPLNNICP